MKLEKQSILALNGDEAVAYAVKQSNVDVVAAYPITPQTIIVERFSEYVADGEVSTEFICTESEHSAITASVSASATGARAFTATASVGLALMHEILTVASGCRTPVVMAVVNRALSSPLNIHCDHSDSMAERDSGWIHLYAENSQETYDSIIQAFKIAENPKVLLPVMVGLDGFTLSHTLENVSVLSDESVKKFVNVREFPSVTTHEGRTTSFKLDPTTPFTVGPIALPNYYFEFKRQQEDAMQKSFEVIKSVHREYGQLSGRFYGDGLVDAYQLDDAELAIICLGSTAGTVKTVIDDLRAKEVKIGLLRLRVFRPLPINEIITALKNVKALAVMDRSLSFGGKGGPLFHEIRHALYDSSSRPNIVNYIYGLGGRDTKPDQIHQIAMNLQDIAKHRHVKKPITFLGLRE